MYSFILDMIDTKHMLPKQQLLIKSLLLNMLYPLILTKKTLELIKIWQILNLTDVVETLPCDIQTKDNIYMLTYQLGNAVRNNLLN